MQNGVGLGFSIVNYMRTNAISLIATGTTVAVGAAVAAAGPKVVVTTCLAGGGLFAGFVVHEASRTVIAGLGNVVSRVKESFRNPQQPPAMRQAAAS